MEKVRLNVPALTALCGAVFGFLIFLVASESFGMGLLGLIFGIAGALVFNAFLLPHKSHDR
ncbi:MAG TPA: hypothetical protein VK076_11245 [Candidatus Sphingobacterium stercoripullorum]|uniref:Uncharacterized protein n=1 Tax=Candidatus Sphingobacterium stercoripullorum TaxID=2838759 RepID=A0A9D1W7K0_9SPHI|nr:hypothetical protein [Candidatus Sphingobacterium stercoripullorum]HLR51142.1 hypothetical protein [Candidatus Sphingobacterium stercoripullorum]